MSLRPVAALMMACLVGVGSCSAAFSLVGGHGAATGAAAAVRLVGPFVLGALIAAWSYYLLLRGEREDLLSRRERRAALSRRVPSPFAIGARAGLLVLSIAVAYALMLRGFDLDWAGDLMAMIAIGSAVLLAVPLGLFVGIATALARARQQRLAARDDGGPESRDTR